MIRIFIGGSRKITKLPSPVAARIERIIDGGLAVLVGDAPGADRCVQQYLAEKLYENVVVFHTGDRCRNNVGQWESRSVPASSGQIGIDFYAVKDSAMAREADYGLMIWNGKSRGTLTNVRNLLKEGKKVVVFLSPNQSFHTIQDINQLSIILFI